MIHDYVSHISISATSTHCKHSFLMCKIQIHIKLCKQAGHFILNTNIILVRANTHNNHSFTHSQVLQPMQGLGQLKKPPPVISISGPGPPVPESQLLCILPHSINPSQVWPSCSSSALRLIQGNFRAWKIILHSH